MGNSSNFERNYIDLLEQIPLSDYQKEIIKYRYIMLVRDAELSYKRVHIIYVILINIITVAGVLTTGLISLSKVSQLNTQSLDIIFWLTWVLSIIFTILNKFIYSFNITGKCIIGAVTMEKLYSEGWSFLSGTKKYKKCIDIDSRFYLFCSRVENIRLKATENIHITEGADANNALAEAKERPANGPEGIILQ